MLREELILGDTQLPRWHEVEGVPAGKGVRGQICWEVSESLESDVLVRWPSIWQIPLETSLDKSSGEGSVVPVHDQVDGGKGTEGLALISQYVRGDDSNPEGVEGGNGVNFVAGVRSQVIVVKGEFVGIPEEIEDTSTKVRSSATVACGLGGRSGLFEVVTEDSVRFVWKGSHGSMAHSRRDTRMSGTYTRSSSSRWEWCS